METALRTSEFRLVKIEFEPDERTVRSAEVLPLPSRRIVEAD